MAIIVRKQPGGQLRTLTDDLRYEFETSEQFEYPYYVRICVTDSDIVTQNTVITLFNRATQVRVSGSNDGSGFVGTGVTPSDVAQNLFDHLTILDNADALYSPNLLRQVPGRFDCVEIAWDADRWTPVNAVNFLTNDFSGIPDLREEFIGAIRRQVFLNFQLIYGGVTLTNPSSIDISVSGDGQDGVPVSSSPFLPAGGYNIDLGELTLNLGLTAESHPIRLTIDVGPDTVFSRTVFTAPTATVTEEIYQESSAGTVQLGPSFVNIESVSLTEDSDELTYFYDARVEVPQSDAQSWSASVEFELRIGTTVISRWQTPDYPDGSDIDISGIQVRVTQSFSTGQVLTLYARQVNPIPPGQTDARLQNNLTGTKTLNVVQPVLSGTSPTPQTLDFGTGDFLAAGGNIIVRFTNPSPGADLSGNLIFDNDEFTLTSTSGNLPEASTTKEYTFPFSSVAGEVGQCVVDPRQIIQDLMTLNFPALDASQQDFSSPGGYMEFSLKYRERYVDIDGTLVVTTYGAPGDGVDVEAEVPELAVLRSVVPLGGRHIRTDQFTDNKIHLCENTPAWLNIPSIDGTDRIRIRDGSLDNVITPQWAEGPLDLDDTGTAAVIPIDFQGSETTIVIDSFKVFRYQNTGNRAFRLRISFAGGPVQTLNGTYSIRNGEPFVIVPQRTVTLTGLDSGDTEALLVLEALGPDHTVVVEENKFTSKVRQLSPSAAQVTRAFLGAQPFTLFHYPVHKPFLQGAWKQDLPDVITMQPFNIEGEPTGELMEISYKDSCDCSEYTMVWQGLAGGWESLAFERIEQDGLQITGAEIDFYKHESEKWNDFYADTYGTVARIDSARDTLVLRSRRLHPKERHILRSLSLSPVHYLNDPEYVLRQVYVRPQNVTLFQQGEVVRVQITLYDTDRILTQQI